MQSTVASEQILIIKALKNILQDRGIKKARHCKLKNACKDVLEWAKRTPEWGAGPRRRRSPVACQLSEDVTADVYLVPLELACRSESATVVVSAADCLQKLISHGHLTGDRPDPTSPAAGQRQMDRIVQTVCGCFTGAYTDEQVQLHVLKLILTVLTSRRVRVHEGTVLRAMRTCYDIHVTSRSAVCQTAARATLTQFINVLFMRLEEPETADRGTRADSSSDDYSGVETPSSTSERDLSPIDDCSSTTGWEDSAGDWPAAAAGGRRGSGAASPRDPAGGPEAGAELLPRSVVNELVDGSASSETDTDGDSTDGASVSSDLRDTSSEPGSDRSSSCDMSRLSWPLSQESDDVSEAEQVTSEFLDKSDKDAFFVFRALCTFSMRPLPEERLDLKSPELRSKVLSLELLLSILQSPGRAFTSSEMFISAIRQYLCVALSKNGASSVPEVFQLSLAIFLALLANFRQHLKKQIEVFFNDIILTLLETPSSSFEHKWLVVQALTHVCADAQSVVDIYVNYDCHFASANVFERLVVDLSRLAQGRQVGLTAAQERSIRLRALECLVGLLKCMVEWSREFSTGIQSPACSGLDSERDWSEEPAPATPGTLSTRGSELSLSDHTPEAYESLKQIKDIWEQGIDMFNRKPKRGLAFLQRQGLLKDTPDSIAAFFHEDHRLDRTVLGDFLGEPDQQQVMEAYVDRLDFVGCEFLAALRQFLDGFRLPGEAQKIDRLMEKFASKYCECNPDQELFTSPDTAYVLAFSIIMLTTDLHSAHVKHKITMEQYIRMNRGINGGEDLPTLYLTRIYDDIAGNAIKMRVIPCARPGRQVAQNEKQRRLLFNLEMEQMSMAARSLMEAASHVQAEFTCATHVEHVRPMFQLAWAPVLAAFSTGLQDGEGAEVDDLCLDGVRCAIHIACVFQMQMERDAYLQTLARFALASASAGDAELKAKDMDTVKMLILLALRDGNFLSRPWPEMLRCIAQMEEAHLSGAGWPAQHDGGLARETGELTQRNAGTPNGPLAVELSTDRRTPRPLQLSPSQQRLSFFPLFR